MEKRSQYDITAQHITSILTDSTIDGDGGRGRGRLGTHRHGHAHGRSQLLMLMLLLVWMHGVISHAKGPPIGGTLVLISDSGIFLQLQNDEFCAFRARFL